MNRRELIRRCDALADDIAARRGRLRGHWRETGDSLAALLRTPLGLAAAGAAGAALAFALTRGGRSRRARSCRERDVGLVARLRGLAAYLPLLRSMWLSATAEQAEPAPEPSAAGSTAGPAVPSQRA
ncbi:hypothetical protein [Chitinimonas koreensis]|uniref:hypothetical protein n=1 Tax=Chitinimonas koreensis TaxID=356302 RepID=UPI000426E524|nr:hypothetical protein [Chitinimonas koreensis]QNM95633.1 hypothetical protein H9L41_17485 [Chitinimonas koreensis]